MSLKFVSVIVCTYNRGDVVEDCIDSLLELDYPRNKYEIIFVDDGSTDGTSEIIGKYPVKLIRNKRNLGLYPSKNIGIRESRGEIIAVTDDDCVVDKEWLKNLVAAYDDETGSVGGEIIPYNPGTLLERFAASQKILSQPKDCSFFVGANCSYRRDVLEDVGYFDDSFVSGGDVDISFRIKNKGFRLKFAPDARVLHRHRITIRDLFRQYEKYGSGNVHISKKHGGYGIIPAGALHDIPLQVFLSFPYRILTSPFIKNEKSLYVLSPIFIAIQEIAFYYGFIKEKLK